MNCAFPFYRENMKLLKDLIAHHECTGKEITQKTIREYLESRGKKFNDIKPFTQWGGWTT